MHLYLVRHGDALPPSADPTRPLSPRGLEQAHAVARCLASVAHTPITEIWHSSKRRAAQTADIIANALPTPQCAPIETAGLKPGDDPAIIARKINEAPDTDVTVILVGHLPHLPMLTGILLAGEPMIGPVRFATASVAALSWQPHDGWALDWCVRPCMLPD